MPTVSSTQFKAYGAAVLLAFIALALTLFLNSLHLQPYFVAFYIAVSFSAWYGGRSPGVVTTVLSISMIVYFFVEPTHTWNFQLRDIVRIGMFSGAMLIINLFISELKTTKQQIEQLSQQRLQESEMRLHQALAAAKMGTWDWDIQTGAIAWSKEHERLLGLAPGTFDGRYETFSACIHSDDRDALEQAVQRARQDHTIYQHEFRVVWSDGSIHWIEGRGHFFYNPANEAVRMTGTAMDITQRKQAEEALRLSEERYRSLVEATAHSVWVIDANGYNTEVASSWVEVTGQTVEADSAWAWLEPIHPDDRDRVQQTFSRCLQTGELYEIEHRVLNQTGEYRLYLVKGAPVYNSNGSIREWVGTLSDITERRQAEVMLRQLNEELEQRVVERTSELAHVNASLQQELRERQRAQEILEEQAQLLDLAQDTIMTRTPDGTITFWNRGAEQTYGWTRVEALGQRSHELLRTQFPQAIAEIEHILLTTGYWAGELIHTRRNGTTLTVASRWVLQRSPNSSPVKVLEINNDITERKRIEEQLHLSNERISLANAELARAARLKDEFLAGMSHELRTPLNAILGLSEALLEEVFGQLTSNQRNSLTTIQQSGQHLLELINDILDLSKVESGKMELEMTQISIQTLCDVSLSFVKQQAARKKIQLSCEITDCVNELNADERRLRQVLINLLTNAVKFTPDGGKVHLAVSVNLSQETVEFSVSDTGIGIAPENMDKLFKPFVQLDSSLSRRYAGTGLGLSLVRRIVELHGGSIVVESKIDQGSRFTVILPWNSADHPASSVASPNSLTVNSFNGQQALIVEDSEAAAQQIARYLSELGAQAVIHAIGEGVVDAVLRTQPDVIILDILLPDRSGWEVLTQLRNNPSTVSIPVIIVSVVDERSRASSLGAEGYLLKPITRQQFQSALSQVLLPINPAEETKALVVAPNKSPDLPLILLAEDNEANITVMLSYLKARGLRVAIARNGLEAVQLAKQYQPDLILMDIQMPEMDGLEATRRIRADPALAMTPIIALTALAMPGDRDRCLAAGVNEYMTKPVSLKQLLQMIKQYIREQLQ